MSLIDKAFKLEAKAKRNLKFVPQQIELCTFGFIHTSYILIYRKEIIKYEIET